MPEMDEAGDESQASFIVDEVSNIIKEAIEEAVGGNAYQQSKVNQWTSAVVESCLSALTKLQKPFKYIGFETCGKSNINIFNMKIDPKVLSYAINDIINKARYRLDALNSTERIESK